MTQVLPLMTSPAVSSLSLSYQLKSALTDAGYKHLKDLDGLTAEDLAAELGIALQQAEQVVHAKEILGNIDDTTGKTRFDIPSALPGSPIKASTAADLLSTAALPRFSTFSSSLDRLIAQHSPSNSNGHSDSHGGYDWITTDNMKGALLPGMSAEVSGPPGSGKTVIAIALALSARTASDEEDAAEPSEVLIVDTEGSLTPCRLRAAAESRTRSQDSVNDMLAGIHLVRVPSQVRMIAFLYTLDDWIDAHPKVKLVLFDTLSYHFRHPGMDMSARRRMMDLVKERIGRLTTVNRCAVRPVQDRILKSQSPADNVVIMNQLATKLLTLENKPANFETGDRAVLMPQLGDTWTTGKTLRLVLFRGGRGDDMRYAHASSAGGNEDTPWAKFDISHNGLPCDFMEEGL